LNTINLQTILYKKKDMSMNWRTGFHRVFLLATIGWVIWVLMYGFWIEPQQYQKPVSEVVYDPATGLWKIVGETQLFRDKTTGKYWRKEGDRYVEVHPDYTVTMQTPDGRKWNVPLSQVQAMKDRFQAQLIGNVAEGDVRTRFGIIEKLRIAAHVLPLIVAPPVLAYGAFLSLCWVVRGFRKPSQ
jgi:hypothetical protein